MVKVIPAFLCILAWNYSTAQRILIANGHLHPVVGQEIVASLVEVENGRIIGIKNAISSTYNPQDWDTVIDATDAHIYPGFVAANSTLGLTEIEAVRASNDYNEIGSFNPHIRSQIAFNVESKVLATVRSNGVLLVQATPRGGIVSGTSSIMASAGWNWEDATVLADDGIHVNWPMPWEGGGWWAEPADKTINSKYLEAVKELERFLQQAKVYSESNNPTFDARFQALEGCFKGKKRIYFHAEELRQLADVLEIIDRYKFNYPVIVGGSDAYLLGQRLVDSKIPIMLSRLHRLPDNEEDPVDLPYKLPYLLYKMGVTFSLQNSGGMEAMNARNLPFLAGTAEAYGLPSNDALRAITLTPCEIMGIDKDYGSLEVGKSATLFVSRGPALDMRTNSIQTILINGKLESTLNFQEELYLKYQKKYLKKN
jgi:hypothetical protein